MKNRQSSKFILRLLCISIIVLSWTYRKTTAMPQELLCHYAGGTPAALMQKNTPLGVHTQYYFLLALDIVGVILKRAISCLKLKMLVTDEDYNRTNTVQTFYVSNFRGMKKPLSSIGSYHLPPSRRALQASSEAILPREGDDVKRIPLSLFIFLTTVAWQS
ncbi:hypothetical protein evm_012946 [Chilo suppressalis]|nr:hypothetical protein evm_012946 [Chilo suppressalis]